MSSFVVKLLRTYTYNIKNAYLCICETIVVEQATPTHNHIKKR